MADAVGVPADATWFEVSDTATAYVGLTTRWSGRSGDDLMLVWNEQSGWAVAVEPAPGDALVVLAYFAGTDVVPAPTAVARFVSDVVADGPPRSSAPVFSAQVGRPELAARLAEYSYHAG